MVEEQYQGLATPTSSSMRWKNTLDKNGDKIKTNVNKAAKMSELFLNNGYLDEEVA